MQLGNPLQEPGGPRSLWSGKQKRRITEAEREPIAALFVMAAKADGDGKSARIRRRRVGGGGRERPATLYRQSMESRREFGAL